MAASISEYNSRITYKYTWKQDTQPHTRQKTGQIKNGENCGKLGRQPQEGTPV